MLSLSRRKRPQKRPDSSCVLRVKTAPKLSAPGESSTSLTAIIRCIFTIATRKNISVSPIRTARMSTRRCSRSSGESSVKITLSTSSEMQHFLYHRVLCPIGTNRFGSEIFSLQNCPAPENEQIFRQMRPTRRRFKP